MDAVINKINFYGYFHENIYIISIACGENMHFITGKLHFREADAILGSLHFLLSVCSIIYGSMLVIYDGPDRRCFEDYAQFF